MRSKVTVPPAQPAVRISRSLGRFDVIFCRNVLIYFDAPRKTDILTRMSRQLAPDGFLLLGASESLIGLKTDLVAMPDNRAVYTRAGSAATPTPALAQPKLSIPLEPASPAARFATAAPALRAR